MPPAVGPINPWQFNPAQPGGVINTDNFMGQFLRYYYAALNNHVINNTATLPGYTPIRGQYNGGGISLNLGANNNYITGRLFFGSDYNHNFLRNFANGVPENAVLFNTGTAMINGNPFLLTQGYYHQGQFHSLGRLRFDERLRITGEGAVNRAHQQAIDRELNLEATNRTDANGRTIYRRNGYEGDYTLRNDGLVMFTPDNENRGHISGVRVQRQVYSTQTHMWHQWADDVAGAPPPTPITYPTSLGDNSGNLVYNARTRGTTGSLRTAEGNNPAVLRENETIVSIAHGAAFQTDADFTPLNPNGTTTIRGLTINPDGDYTWQNPPPANPPNTLALRTSQGRLIILNIANPGSS